MPGWNGPEKKEKKRQRIAPLQKKSRDELSEPVPAEWKPIENNNEIRSGRPYSILSRGTNVISQNDYFLTKI